MGHSVNTHMNSYGSYTDELAVEKAFKRHAENRIEAWIIDSRFLGINPRGEIRTVSFRGTTTKASQFIQSDSYSLKTSDLMSINTYTVNRINGLATLQNELKDDTLAKKAG